MNKKPIVLFWKTLVTKQIHWIGNVLLRKPGSLEEVQYTSLNVRAIMEAIRYRRGNRKHWAIKNLLRGVAQGRLPSVIWKAVYAIAKNWTKTNWSKITNKGVRTAAKEIQSFERRTVHPKFWMTSYPRNAYSPHLQNANERIRIQEFVQNMHCNQHKRAW